MEKGPRTDVQPVTDAAPDAALDAAHDATPMDTPDAAADGTTMDVVRDIGADLPTDSAPEAALDPPRPIAPGDVNGDGRADILANIVTDIPGDPSGWHLCTAPVSPDRSECEPRNFNWTFGRLPQPLADLDGDGYNDVASAVLYRGGPTGLVMTSIAVPIAQSVGDVDGDGAAGPMTATPVLIPLP